MIRSYVFKPEELREKLIVRGGNNLQKSVDTGEFLLTKEDLEISFLKISKLSWLIFLMKPEEFKSYLKIFDYIYRNPKVLNAFVWDYDHGYLHRFLPGWKLK